MLPSRPQQRGEQGIAIHPSNQLTNHPILCTPTSSKHRACLLLPALTAAAKAPSSAHVPPPVSGRQPSSPHRPRAVSAQSSPPARAPAPSFAVAVAGRDPLRAGVAWCVLRPQRRACGLRWCRRDCRLLRWMARSGRKSVRSLCRAWEHVKVGLVLGWGFVEGGWYLGPVWAGAGTITSIGLLCFQSQLPRRSTQTFVAAMSVGALTRLCWG